MDLIRRAPPKSFWRQLFPALSPQPDRYPPTNIPARRIFVSVFSSLSKQLEKANGIFAGSH